MKIADLSFQEVCELMMAEGKMDQSVKPEDDPAYQGDIFKTRL